MEREQLRICLTGNAPIAPDALYALGIDALDAGLEVEVAARMRQELTRSSDDYRMWQLLGLALRATLDAVDAHAAFAQAARWAPRDPLVAHSLARTAMEAGLPAVRLYAAAKRLAPNDGQVLVGECAAMLADGEGEMACDRLAAVLAVNPGWYDGHAAFARLASASGRSALTRTIDEALARYPRDATLWRTAAAIRLSARDYAGAHATAMRANESLGADASWLRVAAGSLSEMGGAETAQALFDRLPDGGRAQDMIGPIRNFIRLGRYDAARRLAERAVPAAEEAVLWPYRALLWRILGDARWEWLEGDDRLIGFYDLRDAIGDMDDLVATLRSIHARSGLMLDQSVRGGTQTDGHLFARGDPAVRRLRSVITEAVDAHIARLPAPVAGHPTLMERRSAPRFAGAWSVRLTGSGFHVDHVHPQGWLSSAFYVTVPAPPLSHVRQGAAGAGDDAARAGRLTFGECRDLIPDLEGFRSIAPQPGHLALFPSTMWHGTRPFGSGERMTVAFDVVPS